MPFSYVVNKNSSIGTLADETGKFSVKIKIGDTLSFSCLGYGVTKVFSHLLKDSVRNNLVSVKIILKQKANELRTVIISNHSFTKEEKEYYKSKIDEYHQMSNPFTSNSTGAGLSIDALYYAFSKKGKELEKLSGIYRQLLIDEVREHRLSDEKVRMITGNDTLNVKSFMNNCYLPDQFVISASDYELYFAVKRYYEQYTRKK
jgi:hypothetical protein